MIYHSLSNKDTDRKQYGFSAIDIELPAHSMNVAEITLTARYPEKGYVLNTESEMVVRILEGATVFECEGEQVELSEGATVLVETHKKYCWSPKDTVTLYVVSSPKWTVEQQMVVE